MALGHLRIDPWDWPRWTLKEFNIAYEGWAKINVQERWEQIRALSFFSLAPHDSKGSLKKWEDVFSLSWDKKPKVKSFAKVGKMTEADMKEFEDIIKNSVALNGK